MTSRGPDSPAPRSRRPASALLLGLWLVLVAAQLLPFALLVIGLEEDFQEFAKWTTDGSSPASYPGPRFAPWGFGIMLLVQGVGIALIARWQRRRGTSRTRTAWVSVLMTAGTAVLYGVAGYAARPR